MANNDDKKLTGWEITKDGRLSVQQQVYAPSPVVTPPTPETNDQQPPQPGSGDVPADDIDNIN